MSKRAAFLLGASIMFSMPALADGAGDPSGTWRLNPSIGLQVFDEDRNLDNAGTFIGGLEYRYDEKWGTELSIMSSSPDSDAGGDVDLLQVGVDGLYFFSRDKNQEAFWILGLAAADFDGGAGSETQLHGGVGIRFLSGSSWSLRSSAKVIRGFEDGDLDTLISVGFSYAFGQTSSPSISKPVVMDGDGDGVADADDRCPTTPAGVQVDSMGCALDGDGDGVADYKDQCPSTPAGREVDAKGCKFVLTSNVEIELKVNFETNSAVVEEAFLMEVEKVAKFMNKYGAVTADIEGHTDSRGAAQYNKALSQRRADAVKGLLVERYGIDVSRLSAKGYGEEKPLESNDSSDGRRANRRVVAVMTAVVEK